MAEQSKAQIAPETLDSIIALAERAGYSVARKADGTRTYVKNLELIHRRLPHPIYIHLVTGIDRASRKPNYLKVGIHPDDYSDAALNPARGITAAINRQNKTPYFTSSNYAAGYPAASKGRSSVGRQYQVDTPSGTLDGLDLLLRSLAD